MNVQFIDTEAGRFAVLPEAEYRRFVESAEDAEDIGGTTAGPAIVIAFIMY